MTKRFFQTTAVLAAVAMMSLAGSATANVWIDESFDGNVGTPFSQGNGSSATAATIDRHDGDNAAPVPLTGPLLTHTGTVVTSKSFAGSSSYRLNPGQTLACADGYDGQGHGDWIYFQFAINVDPIPVAAGNIATFTYTNIIDSVPHNYVVSVDANGSGGAVISAAVSQNATPVAATGGITTIDTLTGVNDWTFLTLQLGVTNTAVNQDRRDPNMASAVKATGAYFFASSTTASVVFPYTGGNTKDAGAWSLVVNGSTTANVYIDTVYWEGAMEDKDNLTSAGQANQYLKDFATGVKADVSDWSLYN